MSVGEPPLPPDPLPSGSGAADPAVGPEPAQNWGDQPQPPPAPAQNWGAQPQPPPQTQYSPDGKYWWDGQRWVPLYTPPAGGKTKVAAGLLGIFLGDFGIHKFYLGQTGIGILYLVFCWTLIPGLVGFVEGIVFLTLSDEEFARRYGIAELARQRPFF